MINSNVWSDASYYLFDNFYSIDYGASYSKWIHEQIYVQMMGLDKSKA